MLPSATFCPQGVQISRARFLDGRCRIRLRLQSDPSRSLAVGDTRTRTHHRVTVPRLAVAVRVVSHTVRLRQFALHPADSGGCPRVVFDSHLPQLPRREEHDGGEPDGGHHEIAAESTHECF